MKYVNNPVEVDAFEIVSLGQRDAYRAMPITLDNGETASVPFEMILEYEPKVGDYWVIKEDSSASVVAKDEFEANYQPE